MATRVGLRDHMLERFARLASAHHDEPTVVRVRDGARWRETATVLIVAVDDIVRLGVRAALGADRHVRIVGDADCVAVAVRRAASLRPMVVVAAGAFPDGGTLEVCARVRDASPATRILILAAGVDVAPVADVLRAGAAGYFAKHPDRHELRRAIRAVAAGETLIDSASTRVLLHGMHAAPARRAADEIAMLAVQERRVLALVAEGKTNKEIAAALRLSDKTVKNYLSHAFEKLHVTRRAHAAVLFSRASGGAEPVL